MKVSNNRKMVFQSKQKGAALFVALIMLVALTIIGVTGANRGKLQSTMAANTHLKNISFNAAETAIDGYLIDTRSASSPLLVHMRWNNELKDQCFNHKGERGGCTASDGGGGTVNVLLDSDKQGVVQSKMDITVVDPCNKGIMCTGFSVESDVGCRVMDVTGTGTAVKTESIHTLTAFEITSC